MTFYPHVCIHEAGHIVVLKAVLDEGPPARSVSLENPEPVGWADYTRALLTRLGAEGSTRVTAFLLGGYEALRFATTRRLLHVNSFHGLNGPDGIDCDAELIDLAVMSYGADRWSASDLARKVVERNWEPLREIAADIGRSGEVRPYELAHWLARVV